ncbi:hypothetical protein COCNU_16G000580 [Cocos nucifera]|uniref:Uncharacterized protein n=1 Tax=Cocos nucifera TaxID=13894 RepID=A0A8K0IXZ9_COCNU|nr:hypothetical protein COCNU_16G000580 [Cocos nucifera]
MLIRSVPALEPAIIVSSPALSDEASTPTPDWQEEVMERKKKKKVISKKGHDPLSPANVEPVPQRVSFKPLIKGLKKEVHQLRKRLKNAEDDLQAFWKNASKATKEVTCLQSLHMKDSVSFCIPKRNFEKELAELRKSTSDKSWVLTAKIGSLEIDLKKVKEKIHLLEESSSWSTDEAQHDWDWSKKFS